MNNGKEIPKFNNKDEKRYFWVKTDSTEYVDRLKVEKVTFSKLVLTTKIE